MKVRIGYGLGNLRPLSGDALGSMAEALERNGFDSLWLSERISGPAPDPLLALTFAAARTEKIKLGTSVSVLPGRSPAIVAKEWATLDVLSGGRALPAFGLGIAHPVEQQAFGVERGDRASIFDEALPLLRRLWTEDDVDHDGRWFHYERMNVLPKPAHPLDVWLGGRAPAELRRVGRLADGWLASFSTPEQCKAARVTIEDAADGAGRSIDPEHFGVMALYTHGPLPDGFVQAIKTRNPDVDVEDLVARGWSDLRDLCERYVAVGFSKLVLVPLGEPGDWNDELTAGADALLSLQTSGRDARG
jgi:probable F420-dependent oxidoreductase